MKTPYMHSIYHERSTPAIPISTPSMKYQVDMPYPEVTITNPDANYLPLLFDDFAGIISELSCSTRYIYEHLVTDATLYPDMKAALEGIAIVEMKHLDLIGTIITQLGGDPRYWSINADVPTYWTPKYIKFTRNPREILLEDIRTEQLVITIYENQIRIIQDKHISDILKRIILDEQLHIKILTELNNKYFGPLPQ